MDLFAKLEVLAHKFLGPAAWSQYPPRDICDALLARAFVEQWDPNQGDGYFLIRAHAQLQLGGDNGQT